MNEDVSATKANAAARRYAQQWNYRPEGSIQTSPLFQWPFKPASAARWLAARWFAFGENLVIVCLAAFTWHFLQPSLEHTKTFEFSWLAWMFVRNALIVSLVAGGLHYWLHIKKAQENKLKFDTRELDAKGGLYTFNSQLKDNIFWTLGSGVLFWTGFEALMLWAMANGYAPVLPWMQNPVWFIALFFLTPLWISFHFYWIHRFLHWPPVYKKFHALHHRNTNVGPWSGLSMHPFEHLFFFSSVLIHFLLSAHPVHIFFHMQHQALTAVTSHAGFEKLLLKKSPDFALGNFHHQLHHRYFECNYGNLEVPWDKVFGSFHDGTEQSHAEFVERRKQEARRGA